jgi:hypothetical protein
MRFFGKREKKFEETKILLTEVEGFLSNKMEKEFEPLKRSVKEEYSNLQLVASNMQNQLKTLEDATYPERTYPFIISRAVSSRKRFIYKMNFLIKQIQKPLEEDNASILNFYNETDKLINNIDLDTAKDYSSLKILFESEGKEVIQSFRQITELENKLGDIVKKLKESNLKFLKAKEDVSEIIKLTEKLKRNEINELNKKLKETEEKNKKIEDELENLQQSSEWKIFLEMQKTKEEIKINMQNKKSEFIQCLSRAEVPLKKYNWSVKNKVLDYYIQKLFEPVLLEDPKGKIFTSAIRDIKIKIIEKKMELKDNDKFLDIISKMIEDNTVGKLIEGYLSLLEELKKQEGKILSEEIPKRKIKLENEIIVLKKKMEEIKNEEKIVEEQNKKMQKEREQKLNDLENLINNYSDKRTIIQLN